MKSVVEWFEHSPRTSIGGGVPSASLGVSPLQRKCDQIQNHQLLEIDPALHVRLGELGIEPQLYLLRWLRLLFVRCVACVCARATL